jgi:RNA polymerase sigma factor (sigma-70 family)
MDDPRTQPDDLATPEALAEHLARLGPYLDDVARKQVRGGHPAEFSASDLVQWTHEAVLGAIRDGRLTYIDEARFKTYIRTTLERKYLSRIKLRDNVPRHRLPEEPPASATSPSQGLDRDEQAARLRRALDQLTPRDRQLATWRVLDQLTYDEIGRRLGISGPGALKACEKALARLKALFEDGVARPRAGPA